MERLKKILLKAMLGVSICGSLIAFGMLGSWENGQQLNIQGLATTVAVTGVTIYLGMYLTVRWYYEDVCRG